MTSGIDQRHADFLRKRRIIYSVCKTVRLIGSGIDFQLDIDLQPLRFDTLLGKIAYYAVDFHALKKKADHLTSPHSLSGSTGSPIMFS